MVIPCGLDELTALVERRQDDTGMLSKSQFKILDALHQFKLSGQKISLFQASCHGIREFQLRHLGRFVDVTSFVQKNQRILRQIVQNRHQLLRKVRKIDFRFLTNPAGINLLNHFIDRGSNAMCLFGLHLLAVDLIEMVRI